MSRSVRRAGAVSLILVISALLVLLTREQLRLTRSQTGEKERPPLYLPSAKYVKMITLGYQDLAADLLWFSTVNYFGKQYLEKKDFNWLYHRCDLVTKLDPHADHVYEFCATLLSWVARRPDQSTAILDRAVQARPDAWRFHYLRGFNYWYFDQDFDRAREELTTAARLPGAPPFLASLASRLMVRSNDIDNAVNFITDMVQHAKDPSAKEALTDKLKRAYISRNERLISQAAAQFQEQFGRKPADINELVGAHLLAQIPPDNFGGTYRLNQNTGEPETTSGEKGLEFYGKTAETGIYKNMQ